MQLNVVWQLAPIKWQAVLRLKEIRYCSIVPKSSLKTLAFLNIECKKYKNLETKCVTTSPGLPYTKAVNRLTNISDRDRL